MGRFSRFAITNLDASPPLFSVLSVFSAALVLTIIAGPGKGSFRTARSLHTWLYAIFQILTGIFKAYAYTLITTTEANLLFRILIVLSILTAFFIFGRKPVLSDMIGSVFVLAGLGYLASTLPEEVRGLAIVFVAISSLFMVLRTIVAETHPESNEACTVKDQCRVTGEVLMITSFIFVVCYGLIGFVVDSTGSNEVFNGLPSFSDFKNPQAIAAALFCGAFTISVGKYLYFYITKNFKTENYLVVGTFIPVFTYIMEIIGHHFGLLDISSLDKHDLIAGGLILGGALFMIYMRQKEAK